MKLSKLRATDVHGYLPINVDFFDDLTFLVGVNGSGKTSALRIIMALLTPNIVELGSIVFSEAEVTVTDGGKSIAVKAVRNPEGIYISTSESLEDLLIVNSSELEVAMDAGRREENRSPIHERWVSHPVFKEINKISSPMFLGLDRRFFVPGYVSEEMDEVRRREYMARRYFYDDSSLKMSPVPASLVEVNYLVANRMQEIRAEQEKLDENLRTDFFEKAFEYRPSDAFRGKSSTLPSRSELETYRKQLNKIEEAAEGIKIPLPAIQSAASAFFEKLSKVVDALERDSQKLKDKKAKKTPVIDAERDYFEWVINKPQADKIIEHLRILEIYIEKRNSLRHPIERFLSLVNEFLVQTEKKVSVASNGQLTVSVSSGTKTKSITALSSGERQLLIMLAHLSLNPRLEGSGVFIVDEPELSLHIDWQEKFVDSIIQANENVQVVLATHSPAIILDRVDSCRSMN